jgi:hypothetical protein
MAKVRNEGEQKKQILSRDFDCGKKTIYCFLKNGLIFKNQSFSTNTFAA